MNNFCCWRFLSCYKNLGVIWIFKLDGNSVISMISVHRSCYIAGDLRFGSRRTRGRPRLCAGAEKSPAWLPCASEPRYLTLPSPFVPVPLLCFLPVALFISSELPPSNQRLCRHSIALNSFATPCAHS